MKISKPVIIRCNKCNEIIEVETDFECIESNERNMGPECHYESIIEDYCPNCGNAIYINLSVWEYPVGAVNYQEEQINGAEILDGPDYNPFDYDDFENDDY